MKTKVILAALLACIGITAQAQDIKTEEPKGKAIVQVLVQRMMTEALNWIAVISAMNTTSGMGFRQRL